MTAETKTCTKCEITKPLGEFYSRNGKPVAGCKECAKAVTRARYAANREEIREVNRAYREANRGAIAEHKRAYYEANREEIRARSRAYYEANREDQNEKSLAYREANRKRLNAHARAYNAGKREENITYARAYREANREEIREANRAYYAANRRALVEYRRAYYEANREEIRAYEKANPEAGRAGSARRRARMAAVEVDPTLTREALRERDGDGCRYCGVLLDFTPVRWGEYRPTAAHLDHVVPISRGGPHTFDNAVLACARCNLSKGDKTPQEWEEMTAA